MLAEVGTFTDRWRELEIEVHLGRMTPLEVFRAAQKLYREAVEEDYHMTNSVEDLRQENRKLRDALDEIRSVARSV